jgi:D-alanyl-D-alanine carboxypeptidase
MDPHATNDFVSAALVRQVYDSLVTLEDDMSLSPGIASEWDYRGDNTWRFAIRDDITFHDGTPMTVEDVVFSIMRQKESPLYRALFGTILEAKAVDGTLVDVVTDGPDAILPRKMVRLFVMSKDWASENGVAEVPDLGAQATEAYSLRHANGTGAMMLASHEPGTRVVFAKNPDYWSDFPGNVEEAIYSPIGSSPTRVAALLSGELDLITDLPIQDIERVEATDGYKVAQVPQQLFMQIEMDGTRDVALAVFDKSGEPLQANPFKDVRVRRAIAHAVDPQAVVERVMRGNAKVVGGPQALGIAGYQEDLTEPIAYDLDLRTPMLSARRIPRTLQAPVIDDEIRPVLEAIAAGSPPASCLMVQVGDRVLEPQLNVTVSLVPASNQKLLTTYATLLRLGPGYRYQTRVAASAAPDEAGVVNGDLYFIGSGDPFLTTDDWWIQYGENLAGRFHTRLEELADAIAASGVTQITGSVVGDESLFDNVRFGPWDERHLTSKQSGPLSALSVNEGYVAWPDTDRGSTRARQEAADPPVDAASLLSDLLRQRDVAIGGGPLSGVTPATAVELAVIESPPLLDILTHVNSWSSNFGAEMLLKKLGSVELGAGSTAAGAEALVSILAARGIPVTGLAVVDGSGLADGPDAANTNLLTCQALVGVLADAGAESEFAATLSIAGERGSLASRFVDSAAEGEVFAKTGTLNGSTALSGYVHSTTDPDITVVFAYIANEPQIISDEEVKGLQDPFVVDMTAYPGDPSIEVLSPLSPSAG